MAGGRGASGSAIKRGVGLKSEQRKVGCCTLAVPSLTDPEGVRPGARSNACNYMQIRGGECGLFFSR